MQAIVLQRILNGIVTLETGNCRPLVGEIVVTERYDGTYSEDNSNYDIDNQAARLYDRQQSHRRDCGVRPLRSSIKLTHGHWPMLEDELAIRRLGGCGDVLPRYKWDSPSRLLTLKGTE